MRRTSTGECVRLLSLTKRYEWVRERNLRKYKFKIKAFSVFEPSWTFWIYGKHRDHFGFDVDSNKCFWHGGGRIEWSTQQWGKCGYFTFCFSKIDKLLFPTMFADYPLDSRGICLGIPATADHREQRCGGFVEAKMHTGINSQFNWISTVWSRSHNGYITHSRNPLHEHNSSTATKVNRKTTQFSPADEILPQKYFASSCFLFFFSNKKKACLHSNCNLAYHILLSTAKNNLTWEPNR